VCRSHGTATGMANHTVFQDRDEFTNTATLYIFCVQHLLAPYSKEKLHRHSSSLVQVYWEFWLVSVERIYIRYSRASMGWRNSITQGSLCAATDPHSNSTMASQPLSKQPLMCRHSPKRYYIHTVSCCTMTILSFATNSRLWSIGSYFDTHNILCYYASTNSLC